MLSLGLVENGAMKNYGRYSKFLIVFEILALVEASHQLTLFAALLQR
jgi:hypothetical protein